MATVTPVKRITIDSKNFREEDPKNKGVFFDRMDANVFGQADQLLRKAEMVLQSTVDYFEGFNTNLRQTAQATDLSDPANPVYAGRFVQSAFIKPEDEANVMRSLQSAFNAKIPYSSIGDAGFDIQAEDAVFVNLTKNFKSLQAQSKAIAELDRIGGTLDAESAVTKASPYRSVLSVPMSKADYDALQNSGMTQKQINAELNRYVNSFIPNANKENRAETSRQNEIKKEKEAKKREREEKEKEEQEQESKRKALGTMLKIVSVLTAIADLVRRLTVSALESAVEARSDAIEGHNLGLTTEEVRRYKYFDLAHGMTEGTTISAVSALKTAFGDEKALDINKLKLLSYVLKGDTAELIGSGKYKNKPSKMMEIILNDYMSQFLAGKDSSNNVVGQNKAREDLVNQLRQSFPELATMFAQMTEDYQSGIYKGQFTDFSGWLNTVKVTSPSDIQQNAFQEMGALITGVNAKLQALKDKYLTGFGLALLDLVQKVDNIQFGMPPSDKNKLNKTNKQLNIEAREAMQNKMNQSRSDFESSFASKFGYDLASTGLTIADLASYATLDDQDMSPRANKIREIMGSVVYGDNPDLLAYLGAYVEYARLFKQANEQASKAAGKIEYNKADYTMSVILDRTKNNIEGFIKPARTSFRVYGVRGTVVPVKPKNLVDRLRYSESFESLTPEEISALRFGLSNYLNTYGSISDMLGEDNDNDFLDEIALLYNKTVSKDKKIKFGKGINAKNMSAEGRQQFRELYNAGAFSDEMFLRAYVNLLSGNSNAITRRGDYMDTMENAFYETQLDYKTAQAEDIALAEYILSGLTKAMVESYKSEYAKKGIMLDEEAIVSANADKRTLDITLYGFNAQGQRVQLDTISYGAYDSSVDKSVDVNLSSLTR